MLVPVAATPNWLRWLFYVSPCSYFLQAIVKHRFDTGLSSNHTTYDGSGQAFIDNLEDDLPGVSVARSVGALIAIIVGVSVLRGILLAYTFQPER